MSKVKELKERWKLPMDKFWKNVQRFCIAVAIVIPSTTELATYFHWLPEGAISDSIKTIGGIIITLGILIPKFTVANKEELDKKLNKNV